MTKNNERRTEKIAIRLTNSEKEEWQEKANQTGKSISELLRLAMNRTRTWTAGDRSLIQEKNRQLARIGNNLNQIAKWANTYKSKAGLIETLKALELIKEELSKIDNQLAVLLSEKGSSGKSKGQS